MPSERGVPKGHLFLSSTKQAIQERNFNRTVFYRYPISIESFGIIENLILTNFFTSF
ncbi:MAG: hypothetical protein AAFW70_21410 [Cyanobacteria bacterium J06635_10]